MPVMDAKGTGTTVFLTGASGFIGARLLPALRARGHEVVALVRGDAPKDETAGPGAVRYLRGDLEDPASFRSALGGVDVVVHAAAVTGKAAPRRYVAVNVDGTRELLQAARTAGVRRFLFVSSVAATLPDQRGYPYARSKAAAEALVRNAGMGSLIVRPTIVLGPGSPASAAIRKLATGARMKVFGTGQVALQPIHVDDVRDGIADLVASEEWPSEPIGFGGPEVLDWNELLRRARAALGLPPTSITHLPARPVAAVLRLLEPVLRGVLPLSAAQLTPFLVPTTVAPDAFFLARRDRLRPVERMLADGFAASS